MNEPQPRTYSWIADDHPSGWLRVGSIDVADPANIRWALDRGYSIGSVYDGRSYSSAEPCAADIYVDIDEENNRGLAP